MRVLIIILTMVIVSGTAYSGDFYLSAGPEYFLPMNDYKKSNAACFGLKAELLARATCKFWYGLRVDRLYMKEKDGNPVYTEEIVNKIPVRTPFYFDDVFYVSPVVKWNPFVKNCYNDKLVPYIQGLLHFGFIDENRAKMSRDNIGMEVGAGVGAGIAYTFTWMQRCWMLDLDGVYSMPNIIIQDDAHASLKSLNFGLTIGVAL